MKRLSPRMMANKGFSLLELAVAIAVIGLLVGGGLAITNTIVAYQQRNETAEYLEQVRKAMLVYANVTGGLPYSDNVGDDGMPDVGALSGGLPYNALKVLPQDAWGRQLKYQVNAGLTSSTKSNNCTTLTNILKGTANLATWVPKVWEADAPAAANPLAAAVVIVSAGRKDADGDGNVYDAITDGVSGGSNVLGTPYLRHKPQSDFDDLAAYIGAATLYDWMQCK